MERRHEDAVRERESGEKCDTGHDQPRFIAIPGRCNRIDHPVAHLFVLLREQQRADTEIEAIEHHVHRQGEQHEKRRDQWEIHTLLRISRSVKTRKAKKNTE